MTYTESIHTLLSGDADLAAVLTGGIYLYRDLKGGQINRTDTPDAYDDNELLLPVASVKGRAIIPTSDLDTDYSQYTSLNQTVEIWLYADEDAGWDDLENAAGLIYALLQHRQIPGAFDMSVTNELHEARDPDTNACMVKLDFKIIGYRDVA